MAKRDDNDIGKYLVQMLTDRGDYELAFAEAIRWGMRELVNKFLAEGIDVNWQAPDGGTALMMAAFVSEHQIVKTLLERGADVKAITKRHETALHYAVSGLMPEGKSRKVATLLLSAGADIHCRDDYGLIPADYAREKYSKEYLDMLSAE